MSKKIKNILDVKNAASKLLLKFQTGKITKDVLYAEGATLTIIFNEVMNNACDDDTFCHVKDAAGLLKAIKHFSTI
ncbi:hypothetical protein FJL53_22135 [Salmonella enterica subsp. enterica]|uniref:hypothetical protein n=1 Tax=Citrobacter freundii TaxID=546 RepID=UPI0035A994C1|nr:hypothetical protein [Salmonella enterica subsp. enterica serovar Muenchen]